jgi:hypothetical protein
MGYKVSGIINRPTAVSLAIAAPQSALTLSAAEIQDVLANLGELKGGVTGALVAVEELLQQPWPFPPALVPAALADKPLSHGIREEVPSTLAPGIYDDAAGLITDAGPVAVHTSICCSTAGRGLVPCQNAKTQCDQNAQAHAKQKREFSYSNLTSCEEDLMRIV